jgi:hypothetical protein
MVWTAMAAIGGMLSGVAAILGLFIAKPDTINVLIPQQTLERAGLTQTAAAVPAGRDGVVVPTPASSVTQGASPANVIEISAPLQPPPSRALAAGVTASLISIAERGDRYVATFRFENTTPEDVGVAVQRDGPFSADMLLTDSVGGSCQMAANGEGWGSLNSADVAPAFEGGSSPFRIVAAAGSAQHTIFFNKGRCDSAIASNPTALSVSGAFVINAANARRAAAISFDGLQLTR